ncbi:MAG TPA: transglycosylase SLT domain-containing protein [Chloroflexota bacterium]|nr:transglycosylase SLT domain-containing protein [Chloroflexota bacterium]
MSSWLPLCLLALLLLLHPADGGQRPVAPAASASTVTWQSTALVVPEVPAVARTNPAAGPLPASGAPDSPLFADAGLGRPTPVAVAAAPPPETAENARLLDATQRALAVLGGTAAATWGAATAVGPVLQVRWDPGVPLGNPDAVQQAVVAAVGTVVDAMDRAFPSGFRSDQGTPLAAVEVALPDEDPVLVAVRTYRELAAGEATVAQFASQWRLLRRAPAADARATPPPRLVPEASSEGAPQRWPPQIARFYPEILHAAQVYRLDPDLIAAIMQQESGGRPDAVGAWTWIGHAGRYERAIGMMQVMPNEVERRGWSIDDAWEPQNNILLGARVLRDKLDAIRGDFWTRVQGYYGFGDPLSDYWLERVYVYWLAFRSPSP